MYHSLGSSVEGSQAKSQAHPSDTSFMFHYRYPDRITFGCSRLRMIAELCGPMRTLPPNTGPTAFIGDNSVDFCGLVPYSITVRLLP
jgi:hypothetical protein